MWGCSTGVRDEEWTSEIRFDVGPLSRGVFQQQKGDLSRLKSTVRLLGIVEPAGQISLQQVIDSPSS